MFEYFRTPALLLKKIDKGEWDQLFTVYSRDFGKCDIQAKGIKKMASKLRASSALYSLADIEFIQGKTHKTLTDAVTINGLRGITNSLGKIGAVSAAAELVDRMIAGPERDAKIWDLLVETFLFLDAARPEQVSGARHNFFWKFLSLQGYKPGLYRCCRCKKPLVCEAMFFCSREGGVACGACGTNADGHAVGAEHVKLIRAFCEKPLDDLRKITITQKQDNALAMISEHYLSTIL